MTEKTTETITYKDAYRNSPCSIRFITSEEKAENVVKDPSKPIIRNPLISSLGDHISAITLITEPKKNDPITLTPTVAYGKASPSQ